ncbi:MAG: FRG domain-containing protein [Treponema sp.]|nr:FRG domain-containing protein [Treponema sp.]
MIDNLKIVQINSLDTLIQEMMNIENLFFFRGMASKDWKIVSSADRMLERIKAQNSNILLSEQHQNVFLELKAQSIFIKQNETELKNLLNMNDSEKFQINESNFLIMQVILQHYGYPTRITDWTKNWKKALFFCLEDSTQTGDFALWCIKQKCMPNVKNAIADEKYLWPEELNKNNRIDAFYRRLREGIYLIDEPMFTRIKAQEGVLLASGVADYMIFEDHIMQCDWINNDDLIKFIISKQLRTEIRNYLDQHNITANSLYPIDFQDQKLTLDNSKIEKFMNDLYIKDFNPLY